MPGVVHAYVFNLRAGEFLRIVFEQQDVDLAVEVLDPAQRKILEVDSLNGTYGPEDVPLIAETAGIHEVRVSATSTGQYFPHVLAHRNPAARDLTRAASILSYFRGDQAYRAGRSFAEIEKYYNESARLAEEVGETVHQADAHYKLAELKCKSKRWEECRNSYFRALALYEKKKNLSRLAVLFNELADPLRKLGDSSRAFHSYQRSIELSRKTKRVRTEAIALVNLAGLQTEQGNIEEALQNYERSRELYQQLGSPLDEVKAINGCGHLYTVIGKTEEALALHEEAQRRLKPFPGSQLMAETLIHIGDVYRNMDRFHLSTLYYLRAVDLSRKLGDHQLEGSALNNLGLAYYHLRSDGEALDSYLQAVNAFHDDGLVAYEATAWSNVGWIKIGLDDVPGALKAFESSVAISQKFHHRPTELIGYYGIAWAERHRNNLIAARENIQKAVDILEELRNEAGQSDLRMSILDSRFNIYEFLVGIIMEQHQLQPGAGYNVEAFAASEGARARSLLDVLGKRSAPPLLSMAAVQRQVVDKDTILLEYYIGDEKSFLWAVATDSFVSFELPSRARIEPLARDVYRLLQKSYSREAFTEAVQKTRELAEILLGPVAGRLGQKRLLIVAPPILQYVPFAALPDLTVTDQEPPGSWPTPLIVRHEIVNAPSASVLAALETRVGRWIASDMLAMVADPIYERSDERLKGVNLSRNAGSLGADPLAGRFTRLRYSKEEADSIMAMVGSAKVLDLRGADASRDRILAGALKSYRYINFSAHGDPKGDKPDLSAIVLSAFDKQGQSRDPFLRAKDIQTLDLSADLVVLGSCGSGLGQEVRGEGIVGLTQAFLSAGASRVLVGLWNLDDSATSDFMRLFYFYLLKQGKSPSTALQQAQIRMWRYPKWNAPAYWSGLVLQGKWE